jgi:hypothetical protein
MLWTVTKKVSRTALSIEQNAVVEAYKQWGCLVKANMIERGGTPANGETSLVRDTLQISSLV